MLTLLHPVVNPSLKEFEEGYVPCGALGAILASLAPDWITLGAGCGSVLEERVGEIIPNPKIDWNQIMQDLETQDIDEIANVNHVRKMQYHGNENTKFVVLSASDVPQSLHAIQKTLESKNVTYVSCKDSDKCHFDLIAECDVVILVMSKGMDLLKNAMLDIEFTKRENKALVPVMGEKGYWPICNWMALAVAGTLFFEIYNEKQANSPYDSNLGPPDSTPCKDFCVQSKGAPKYALILPEEREQKQLELLTGEINELKLKLGPTWEPNIYEVHEKPPPVIPPKPVVQDGLLSTNIHYQITRVTLSETSPLFDENGNPTQTRFDFFISYNWAIQETVRKVYEKLHFRNFNGFLDIWGNMVFNMNTTMAAGVERSYAVIVFLTSKYQASPNCQLELGYALYLKKPIVMIYSEPGLIPTPLSQRAIDCAVVSYSLEGLMSTEHDKVLDIDMLGWHLRCIIAKSDEIIEMDQSLPVRNLLKAIEIGKRDVVGAKIKTCKRPWCGKSFDDTKKEGCTVHSAYYLGGSLLAGRWAAGCRKANHTDTAPVWTLDPNYGTWSWN
ncbi:UNVERIFIED_CONTAM: hypothetical protein HDU68_011619 [Siphonaria sp. JEL0065]|nr:hypothetical protein HDU68_011619 [Siphonaria sp. JEL0065]